MFVREKGPEEKEEPALWKHTELFSRSIEDQVFHSVKWCNTTYYLHTHQSGVSMISEDNTLVYNLPLTLKHVADIMDVFLSP